MLLLRILSICDVSHSVKKNKKTASVFPRESVSVFVPGEEANTLAILTEAFASPFSGSPQQIFGDESAREIKPLFMLLSAGRAVAKEISVN